MCFYVGLMLRIQLCFFVPSFTAKDKLNNRKALIEYRFLDQVEYNWFWWNFKCCSLISNVFSVSFEFYFSCILIPCISPMQFDIFFFKKSFRFYWTGNFLFALQDFFFRRKLNFLVFLTLRNVWKRLMFVKWWFNLTYRKVL